MPDGRPYPTGPGWNEGVPRLAENVSGHLTPKRLGLAILAGLLLAFASAARSDCLHCHEQSNRGLIRAHQFPDKACVRCHSGVESAQELEQAHTGLIAFPGNLENARQTCGGCHPAQVSGVFGSVMHTGSGIVSNTRDILDGSDRIPGTDSFQSLGQGPADSLLRKLCASCHLGQPRLDHRIDPVRDRGGGCLACHLNEFPSDAHPALTARVGDARCFGCHSRSGRISLSYAGLAETLPVPAAPGTAPGENDLAQLADGRLVEHRAPDVHHLAGLACIDCHTGPGLMGLTDSIGPDEVDIACDDCHDNRHPRIMRAEWPADYGHMLSRIPFATSADQQFLVTGTGVPLWHIEARGGELYLHPKMGGDPIRIPVTGIDHHRQTADHQSLTCDACHSAWAPQCHGCHLSFDPAGRQWDHVERSVTPGAWHEQRWDIRNGPPPLGHRADGRIGVFVPGMIMSIEHPAPSTPGFVRRFAPLSPHTTGQSRTCESCHLSSIAVGLGDGRLLRDTQGTLQFQATRPTLGDGLPADAWTSLEESGERAPNAGAQPFTRSEIEAIFETPLEKPR